MSAPSGTSPNIALQVIRLVAHRRWWIILPTGICTLVALAFASLRPTYWNATQTLVLRDEAGGNRQRGLGRFESNDAMKTAQETIIEITRNRVSVATAMREIGPPPNKLQDSRWPTADDISETQSRIQVRAPNGAELGKTEVILISAEAETKNRAVALIVAICEQLQQKLRDLRSKRMQSIGDELENHVELAQSDLEQATAALEALETQFGGDLAELRLLSQAGSGESNLRAQQSAIQKEIRDTEATRDRYRQQQDLIQSGIRDTNNLIATPNSLLESQPALRRMRDDLAIAQRTCAELEGTLTKEHPRLMTALKSEQEIRNNLQAELQVTLRGTESDLALSAQRLETLHDQLQDVNSRLERIAGARARYNNLTNDASNCAQVLERTKKDLADARASQLASSSANFLTQLDPPVAGDYPVGPGKKVIVLGGMGGGLAIGCGLLFLLTPLGQTSLRRCGDYLPFGRRSSDRALHGRPSQPVPGGRRGGDLAMETSLAPSPAKSTPVAIGPLPVESSASS